MPEDVDPVITGLGVASPLGLTRRDFFTSLANGEYGYVPPDYDLPVEKLPEELGRITDFTPEDRLGEDGLRLLDRTTLLSLWAAHGALEDAGVRLGEEEVHPRIGHVHSTMMGSIRSRAGFFRTAVEGGTKAINPGYFPNTVMNAPASQTGIHFNLRAFNTTVAGGFNGALQALDYARHALRSGRAERVLVGTTQSLTESVLAGLARTDDVANNRSNARPFRPDRNGFLPAEGSFMFVLEPAESVGSDSGHEPVPYRGVLLESDGSPRASYSGPAQAHDASATERNRNLEGSDAVVASANGSPEGDRTEADVLDEVLEDDRPVIVPKTFGGEPLGASAGFLLAAGLGILRGYDLPVTEVGRLKSPDSHSNEATLDASTIGTVAVHSATPTTTEGTAVLGRPKTPDT